MGKKLKIGIIIAVFLLAGSLVTTAFAGGSEPGSVSDPIVTKSYVDEQINKLKQLGIGGGEVSNAIIVETLNKGDILIAGSGTEFILRSGTAIAYGSSTNGIPDVTGGADIKIGANIPNNHQLIFPKDDGRGIKITAGPAYVMIRGSYEIIAAN